MRMRCITRLGSLSSRVSDFLLGQVTEQVIVLDEENPKTDPVMSQATKSTAVHFVPETPEGAPLPEVLDLDDQPVVPSGAQTPAKSVRFPDAQ